MYNKLNIIVEVYTVVGQDGFQSSPTELSYNLGIGQEREHKNVLLLVAFQRKGCGASNLLLQAASISQ
jgi:hypothetical protein